ncbi:hypothetical protein BDR05DRAFT_999686 [Suillus weaverae]|nr:hypothetical protein BDR05DRAFT_999686 [Suillus weaverae]
MTPSNDLILDPAYWLANPEKEHLLRLQISEAMSTKPLDPPQYDPDIITEPESDLNVPPKPQTLLQPLIIDPDSITESESKLDIPLKHTPIKPVIKPLICDHDSVMELESDLNVPPKPQKLLQSLICDPDSVMELESKLDIPPKHTPKKTEMKKVVLQNTKSATPRLYLLEVRVV